MLTHRIQILIAILILTIALVPFRHQVRAFLYKEGCTTVNSCLAEYGEPVQQRLQPDFNKVGVIYPPARMTLIGLKKEKRLELWVAGNEGEHVFLRSYPILAASGILGPKLKEGDYQVPEGIYKVGSLHPASDYHLALRINYPSEFDLKKAVEDKRDDLGGNIMIHGDNISIGCLAMGDEAIEEIFILAAHVYPTSEIPIILSPVDFRKNEMLKSLTETVPWQNNLYIDINSALAEYQH